MPETTNFNLYKPVAGESGWAAALNGNFETIDVLLYSHQTSIDGHTGTGSNKHNAEQIRTSDGSDVQSALAGKSSLHHSHQSEDIILPDSQDLGHHIDAINDLILALQTGKANLAHEHSEYALQSDVQTIENTLDLLLPDLEPVNLNVDVNNRNGGIHIQFSTTPTVHFTQAAIVIEKAGVEICHFVALGSMMSIPASELSGVENGDVLDVSVTLYSGLSSKLKKVAHTYATTTSPLEERIETIETQLTLGNIIDAFAQDEDALQALANVLHSSNTLAQKVSELIQT